MSETDVVVTVTGVVFVILLVMPVILMPVVAMLTFWGFGLFLHVEIVSITCRWVKCILRNCCYDALYCHFLRCLGFGFYCSVNW